jgi:signal transduction histidine kinase
MAVVGAVGLVATLFARSQIEVLTKTVGPARTANAAVLLGMVNAETATRGYQLGRDPAFLQPYNTARPIVEAAFTVLGRDLGHGAAVRGRLAAERAAADAWLREYATPVIAGSPVSPSTGKNLFDTFRAANKAVGADLDRVRVAKVNNLNHTLVATIVVIGGGLVVGVAVGSRTAVVTTGRLVRPLAGVVKAVGALAEGRLDARLVPSGPAETREVGRSVNMLADQLDRVATDSARSAALLEAANDRLRTANDELEAFSYSVSHDLRAPLRAISGFSRILIDQGSAAMTEETRGYLARIERGAAQMGALIDALLAFAHAGRQALAIRQVDPARIVRDTLAELEDQREGRRIEISIGDLPSCAADAILLTQVYMNLLSNALKFTRERDSAYIQVGSDERSGETVYFVADNGVGFDSRYADKLFGVFQRLHRADQFEGTGVGLALAARIVHRHGGRIWAESSPGHGATFSFTLAKASGAE